MYHELVGDVNSHWGFRHSHAKLQERLMALDRALKEVGSLRAQRKQNAIEKKATV